MVLIIGVQFIPPFDEESQRITDPIFPLKVKVPLLAFAQIVVTDWFNVPPIVEGSTTTDVFIAVPLHPFAVGVIVKVTVIGAFVGFVKIPLMFPLPLDAIPVTEAIVFLVQE